ncbi:hypothetical protein, partial [Mesorhizobium sp. M2A.F.Ca.ET.037.01.1.1]|uniref:hypothetical protein n=1 Tax=Mesorhizobium sp. M2A.F.Ca.ET.037.01.1.1 TaxID=2496748 RepID=UPI001AECEE1E
MKSALSPNFSDVFLLLLMVSLPTPALPLIRPSGTFPPLNGEKEENKKPASKAGFSNPAGVSGLEA